MIFRYFDTRQTQAFDWQPFFSLEEDPLSVSEGGRKAMAQYRRVLDLPLAFRVKFVRPREAVHADTRRPQRFAMWVRTRGGAAAPGPAAPALNAAAAHDADDSTRAADLLRLQLCTAAFVSDVTPVGTPLFANAAAGFQLGMAASLDHTMWIHRPAALRLDTDWMLYETESPVAGGSVIWDSGDREHQCSIWSSQVLKKSVVHVFSLYFISLSHLNIQWPCN